MREVGESAFIGLFSVAFADAQQDGGPSAAIGDVFNVDGSMYIPLYSCSQAYFVTYMGTLCNCKTSQRYALFGIMNAKGVLFPGTSA